MTSRTSPMKLVFYSQSTTLYGAPTSLLNLIQGIVANYKDISIYVVVPSDGPLTAALSKLPLTLIKLPFYRWVYSHSLYLRKKNSNRLLAHIWFLKHFFTKLLLNLFWLPVHLWRINRLKCDVIYTNSSLSPMGAVVARILGIRSVWHHRETLDDQETNFFLEWRKMGLRILNWPDVHIHPSQYLRATYEQYVSSGQSYVVYNGAESTPVPGKELTEKGLPLIFGMVGRVDKQKGQQAIIDTLKDTPSKDIRLNLYGGGEKYYVDLMKQRAPENVFFLGFKPKAEIYNNITFLIINARNESFGRVVAEAYAYGVPVIGLRSGAVPELIDHKETGYLFTTMNEFREIISSLRSLDTASYIRLSENCRRKFDRNFTLKLYATKIMDILQAQNVAGV